MASKKQTKKPCNCKHSYGTVWLGGSNIDPRIVDKAMDFAKHGGTTYILEGKPCGQPGYPPCQ